MGHVDQDESCGGKIPRAFGETRHAAVRVDDIYVDQLAFGDELPCEAHGFFVSFKPGHRSPLTHTLSQQVKASAWSATDFHYPRAGEHSNPIKQALRVAGKHLCPALEPLLFRLPIPHKVLIDLNHPHLSFA